MRQSAGFGAVAGDELHHPLDALLGRLLLGHAQIPEATGLGTTNHRLHGLQGVKPVFSGAVPTVEGNGTQRSDLGAQLLRHQEASGLEG
jgi:hypothetical protein